MANMRRQDLIFDFYCQVHAFLFYTTKTCLCMHNVYVLLPCYKKYAILINLIEPVDYTLLLAINVLEHKGYMTYEAAQS